MGRRGRGGGRRAWKNANGPRVGAGGRPPRMRGATRDEVARENSKLEEYYNSLDILENDAEKAEFWKTMRRELPNSFRFTGSKAQALPVQQLLKDRYIPEITSIEHDGQKVAPPEPIPWFPDQLAWQMTTPKHIIRRFPPFASFQKFLVSETSVGNISRQEVVSMIPPLLMELQPGMVVLDMCAAPGSKSAQLIEMVHAGEEASMRHVVRTKRQEEGREVSPEGDALQQEMLEEERSERGDWSDDGRATGLLIANDSDYKRAHMLTHQMKRLNSPNLIVTNHDATMYPPIKLPSSEGAPRKHLRYDRILADVPCSGDGTCRKNVNVWKDWMPGNALGLFPTQMRILVRALQLLKVGGRVVYSTCSLNPVEDEAVVAAAIEKCGGLGHVEIVDCSTALPDLKRRPGLKTWKVMDKRGHIWDDWASVQEERDARGDNEGTGKLSEGLFPSDKRSYPLQRCMRVYPHLQDTGGFFITVLEKRQEFRVASEAGKVATAPKATGIVQAVNEIETKSTDPESVSNGADTSKIEALDTLLPPSSDTMEDDSTAAERQNMENAPSEPTVPAKRELDEVADAAMATKRPKIRDEVDEPAPIGTEDRRVHWPPPPGANLDSSRPDTAELPVQPADEMAGDAAMDNDEPSAAKIQRYEEPYKYLAPDYPDLESISTFYSLSPRYPRTRFMVRNATGIPARTIYYTSQLAKEILTTNEHSGVKFIHCGVKMFVRQDVQAPDVCKWRIQSEGLPLLEAWIGEERCVRLYDRRTLRNLLVEMFPKLDANGWARLGGIAERVKPMGMGCCVLRVEKTHKLVPENKNVSNGGGEESENENDGFEYRMTLPLWRSAYSLNLMLPKEDRRAMLLRLFNEDPPLLDNNSTRNGNTKSGKFADGKKDGGDANKGESVEEVVDPDVATAQDDGPDENQNAEGEGEEEEGEDLEGGVAI